MNRTDEWYDVEHLLAETWRIIEGEAYGQYLVAGAERSLLIDAGIGVGDLRGLVTDLAGTPVSLLLTHWHWDHIGNAAQFADDGVYVHPADCDADGQVALDGRSDEFVDRPDRFVKRWRTRGNELPDEFDPDAYTIEPAEAPSPIEDGDRLELGDRTLEVVHTPGHSPGHVAVLDRDAGILYGGDVIHRDAGLYAHLQGCNLQAYRETFARLIDLRNTGAFEMLLTSHNPPLTGSELSILDRLEAALQRILDGVADGEHVETDWGPADKYEVDDSTILTHSAN